MKLPNDDFLQITAVCRRSCNHMSMVYRVYSTVQGAAISDCTGPSTPTLTTRLLHGETREFICYDAIGNWLGNFSRVE